MEDHTLLELQSLRTTEHNNVSGSISLLYLCKTVDLLHAFHIYDVGAKSRMESVAKIPALVASTSELYCCCIDESRHREEDLRNVEKQPNSQGSIESVAEDAEESNYFKSAQW